MAVGIHYSGVLYGLALLSLFGDLVQVSHTKPPAYRKHTEFISSSSEYCPVDELNVVSTTTCCSHCPPGLQQQDCQNDEFCYRNPNSSFEISPFDAFGRCCPRPQSLDSMCPYGKPFLDGKYCCTNCGWMQIARNLSGPCPDGYMCATDPFDRRHAVCCPQVLQEYTLSHCEGSWLGFIVYNGLIYDTTSVTGSIKRGFVLNQTMNESDSLASVCCRQAGTTGAYGMIISGPQLHSDIHMKCLHERHAHSIWSTERLRNLALELPTNSSRWQPAYVIETNYGEDTPGFSFDVDPRFHANAKWIWARRDGPEFVSPESTLAIDECIWCKAQLKERADVRELVETYADEDLKGFGRFVELFGLSTSTTFKIHIDLYSNHPECKSSLKFASSWKSEENEEIYFYWVTKTYGADVRFCRQVVYPAEGCSPYFVVEDPTLTLCGQYRSVWITIAANFIQFGIAYGTPHKEKQLTNWTGSVGNKFERLNRLSLSKLSRMRFFRSHSENRCLFMAQEVDELEPCGDGYISDERVCLKCGCCYYPDVLPGRVYENTTLCYRSLSSRYSQTVDQSSSLECRRSFEKVIGHFAFVIENNRTFLLNETVMVKVLLQNSVRNILVRILFENVVFANNLTLTEANVRISEEKMYSYTGSLPVHFNHSGKHVLVAEIMGSDKDRLQKKLTVSVGRLTEIVSIALESCSSNRTVALFAIIVKGFDENIMRMNLDFGDGTVLNKVKVDQSVKRPSWVKSTLLGQIVVLEHVYTTVNMYTATLAVSSLNNGSVLTAQERVFVTLCNQDLSSFGKMIVFDSGFDQSYHLHDQVSLRVFVSDERLSLQASMTGFHLHWFCSTDSSWEFSATNPDGEIPPESVQCFQQKLWLDSYAQMNKSYPESILTFPARELRFQDVPQSYYLHIVMTKPGHRFASSASPGTISLVRGSPPELSITCYGNCGHYFNPSEAMVLYAKCQNCYPGENLTVDWSVAQSASGGQARTFDLKGGTIVYDRYFIVKSSGLKGLKRGMEYLVKVSARRLDGATGDASYDITVKSPMELFMRHSKTVEEEIIYVHKDYLALLSIPLALIVGVIIGVMIRRRREKVAPATKSSQENLNQEAGDAKDEENKDDSTGANTKDN